MKPYQITQIAVLLLLGGCHPERKEVPEEITMTHEISAGMAISTAKDLLKSAGYRPVTSQILFGQDSSWWLSPDNTCVTLIHSSREPDSVIEQIILGEKSKGYGDCTQWPKQQHTSVTRLQLDPLNKKSSR